MSREEVRTKTRDAVLVDQVLHSPVDDGVRQTRRKVFWGLVIAVVVLLVVYLAWRFNADEPVRYTGDLDHFKYGSIGSEPGGSLSNAIGGLLPPYPIFKVLPQICPDKLPGGYASLGLIFEPGHELPVGISRRYRLGFDQVGLNCAGCHTGTVRDSPQDQHHVVAGMPSHQLNLQNFFRFVLDCTLDERFTADNVLGKIAASGTKLSRLDRFAYRNAVIPRTREQTLELAQRLSLLMGDKITEWGPGRVDTFNPYKGLQFNWQLNRLPLSELNGASDFPSLWNQKPRATPVAMQLHWDGNNDSVDERNLSASLGTGVTPVTIDHDNLERVKNWIWNLPPPAYRYPIDSAKAERGHALYRTNCQDCHADHRFKDGTVDGAHVGTVVPIETIGTDPYRLNSYTYVFAANQYTLYPDSTYRFKHFRKTQGYANHPLDGIWARAPYLHNGAVPTLRDLMEPVEARPKRFYRGYDVFDPAKVGFVSNVPQENGKQFFEYDTGRPGNSNSGHLYGTNLPPADKDAIVEYLKMF
jgi:hypothetical protein